MDDLWTRKAREIFGYPSAPKEITEHQFDNDQEELDKWVVIPWQEIPYEDNGFFWAYYHDLTYEDLQLDLFRYAFPVCLARWRWTLMNRTEAGAGDADFHIALARGDALSLLDDSETQPVVDYLVDGICDRLDDEKSNDDNIFSPWARTASLCYCVPVLQPVWQRWLRLDTPGKCLALQHLYVEICNRPESPQYFEEVMQPDSDVWTELWLPENLATFERELTGESLCQAVQLATDSLGSDAALKDLPSHARPDRAVAMVENNLRQIQRQYEETLADRQARDFKARKK